VTINVLKVVTRTLKCSCCGVMVVVRLLLLYIISVLGGCLASLWCSGWLPGCCLCVLVVVNVFRMVARVLCGRWINSRLVNGVQGGC